MTIHEDGYMNVITGMGTHRDPQTTTFFQPDTILTEPMLATIFSGDGVGRKIVEGPADEMIRPWFQIQGDEGKAVSDRLEEIGARESFVEAVTWARLYGGAIAVFVTDDRGGSLDQPLRSFKSLLGVKVFDRYRVRWEEHKPSLNPIKRLSGIPEVVTVTPPNGLAPQKIHESRFVIIPGARVPELIRQRNGGWDDSILQTCYDSVKRYSSSLGYTSNILRDFVQSVLSVKGLTELLAADKDEIVRRRLMLLDLSRSILNTMIIDADGEEYTKSASSVTGLSDVIDRYVENLSMVTGIPASKLMGRTPGALGATGESDMRNYYDMLASERSRTTNELAERTVKLIYQSQDGPTRGKEPEAWSIKWNPFYQPTDKETAELRKQVAETDKIYLEMQVVTPKEVAESRFGGDEWAMDTQIEDFEKRPDDFEPDEPVLPPDDAITPPVIRGDATPRSLYVRRDVTNAAEILSWARRQGFTDLVKPSELHVTIAFSRSPVDWMEMGNSWADKVEIAPGGPRLLETFSGGAQVLLFSCDELKWRHQSMVDRGASWDWPDYQPHITLSYAEMPNGAGAYQGRIVLGPEVFEEVDENREVKG